MDKNMSALDLTDQLIKSDYFSDVNPRNLRRLINIIALTGRLLRAYHIDFNWRILASWIYINEQWPYRCSWIVMHYGDHEEEYTEETTLNEIYEQVKNQIPTNGEPLLELDRNARKFEHFIQSCEPKLTCTILKKILPCTVNLDPYLIKLIKESIDAKEDKITNFPFNSNILSLNNNLENFNMIQNSNLTMGYGQQFQSSRLPLPSPNLNPAPLSVNTVQSDSNLAEFVHRKAKDQDSSNLISLTSPVNSQGYFQLDMSKPLQDMSVADVSEALINNIEFLSEDFKEIYANTFKEKNLNGRVLLKCDLEALKSEINMSFGDWFLFKDWLVSKRVQNQNIVLNKENVTTSKSKTPCQNNVGGPQRKVEFSVTPVKEEKLIAESKDAVELGKKPLNSILVKQSNVKNLDIYDEENSGMSSDEKNDVDKEEIVPLVESSPPAHSDEIRSIGKLGKKIFKSIDNLFHKTERSNSRTVSGSINEENETSLSILYGEEENKVSSASTDEEINPQDNRPRTKLKKTRRESIKMDNLKKNFIKVKNQIISNTEPSTSTKNELKTKTSPSPITASSANAAKRSPSETGPKNTNEEPSIKTYFIFEDEDECYENDQKLTTL
ncbi:kinase D-interacting substrate -like protein [Brachionus plicatilis]|uniref:Kinase D-interacting substrate-like protein n=1 Tax=Brachionus plicatilis TaxID=10195 RepID=A0A3M7PUU6_BRAPC|nr:kinase D-interacting substrate -like protein [Brachionus plicatilis]